MYFPKITLITPSFNQGRFLEQTIRSVLDQGYPNLEYMIIDGGSKDESGEIIKKYQNKLAYWVIEKDKGQAHAINKGLQRATGDIICWINSDDYLNNGALQAVAGNFSDPAINCVIGKIQYFNEKGMQQRSGSVVRYPAEKTLGSGIVPQPAMYFRKSCYDTIGHLDEQLYMSFDAAWYMQYLIYYGINGITEIPETLVYFRFHDSSKTMNNSRLYEKERSSICYSIAAQLNLQPLMQLLEATTEPDKSYHFHIPENRSGISLEKAMNYFVLLLANEYYAASDHKKAAACFRVVDKELLDPASRQLYSRLNFRNTYVPPGIIKLLRRRN